MKKRLLSALLALALVFVLLPTTALADTTPVTDENVKINGTPVTVGNGISLGEGNGTYSYDKSTRTLTLNNATINATDSNIGISFGVPVMKNIDYKIELIGTNTISSTSAQAIYVEYDTSVDACENNTMKRSTLTINGSAGSSLSLNVSGTGSKEAIEAIWSKGDFTLSGGTAVTAFSSDKIAVNVGSMTINNSKLSAQSSSYGTTVVLYGLKMIGDAAEFEALNTSSVVSAVLGTSGASENTDWSNYQFTTGSYSGGVLTKSDPEVCSRETLNKYLGLSQKEKSQYIHIAKRTIALETTSDVRIAGGPAVVGQWTTITANSCSGSYYYNAAKKELTLKDVNIASSSIINGIQFTKDGTYTIKLVGTNTISDVSNGIFVTDDKYITSLNVTITGTGSLDISAKGLAINMKKGDLKFENTGEIKLTTSNISPTHNVLSVSGNITIADMEKYKVEGIVQDNTNDGGDTVTLSAASHLKGYQNPDGTAICLKTITIASKPSKTYYNGTAMKYGETKTVGNGTISCDENGVITLNGVTGGTLEFRSSSDSKLVLEGTNTLSSIVTTQKGLTISGSGSLTVGSIRVTNNDNISADLTINGGAHVTVNRPSSEDEPAVEVSGNLTVTGDGTQLSAECTAATNPAIEVGGNVTISGNPGTNAYTVKAYNKYATQRGRDDNLRPSQMPSAFEISGNLSISGSARVMAKTDSDGAAVWMSARKVISVVDASLIAQNSSHNFSTISFGDEDDMGNIYAKGQVNIVAENMLGSNSRLAHKAIKAYIYNHYSTGDSNPYYIKVVSEGVQSGGNVNVIPGHHTSTGDYKVTITRGDAYTTPQVAANYTIAGQTMYVGKYYKTAANGNITDGTAQDYNIYCDSENDFTLNNATISSTGKGGSTGVIMTDPNASSNEIHIKLIGTNSINNAGHHAILGKGSDSTIIIENAENASNASLTISGNFLPVYSFGNVTINAEVVIINTNGNGYLISTNKGGHANGAFDLGSGYKCYASASTTGNPLEEFNSANYGTYKYLRVTTQTPETGGGSTHQHTWDTTKWYDVGDGYHANKCTGCTEYDLTNKKAHVAWPDESKGSEGHTEKCMLCDYKYDQSVIKPHEWTGWWVSDYQPEVHAQRCNCGYLGSTHSTLKYVAINGEQHQKQCPVDGCDYKIESSTTAHVYEEGSNICTECGYDKSAPCNHTGDRVYTNNGDGTHKVTCKACGATIVEKETHEFDPTGACVCGATQSGGNPTPDNPGTIVIIRPAEEEKPAQQPNPSTGANDLVGLAVAAAVAAALGSAALLRKHD